MLSERETDRCWENSIRGGTSDQLTETGDDDGASLISASETGSEFGNNYVSFVCKLVL